MSETIQQISTHEAAEQFGRRSLEHTAAQIATIGSGVVEAAFNNQSLVPGEGSLGIVGDGFQYVGVDFGKSKNGGKLEIIRDTVNGKVLLDDGAGSNHKRTQISSKGSEVHFDQSGVGYDSDGVRTARNGIIETTSDAIRSVNPKSLQEVRNEAAKVLIQARQAERVARPENRIKS